MSLDIEWRDAPAKRAAEKAGVAGMLRERVRASTYATGVAYAISIRSGGADVYALFYGHDRAEDNGWWSATITAGPIELALQLAAIICAIEGRDPPAPRAIGVA